jgi:ankyrin repeat protein/serine/threonine protein kinase
VDAGAPCGARGPDGSTPLHTAAAYGKRACTEALLAAGADAAALDGGGGTALHSAAEMGHSDVVRSLLASARPRSGTSAGGALAALSALRDALDSTGEAAIHRAAWADKVDSLRALVDAGASMEHRSAGQGATPLSRAAAAGSFDAMAWLLDAGADASARDSDGAMPLHVAASTGNTRAVAALLAAPRVSPSAHCADGTTALHLAARGVHMAVAEALLAAGGDACAQDGRRQRPADVAGSEEMTALMVRSAAAQQAYSASSSLPRAAAPKPVLSTFVPPPAPPEPPRAPSPPRAAPVAPAPPSVPRRASLTVEAATLSDDRNGDDDDVDGPPSPPSSYGGQSAEAVRAEAKARAATMVAQAAARAAANVASRNAAGAASERQWAGRVRVPPGAAAVLGSRPGSPSRSGAASPAAAAHLRAATTAPPSPRPMSPPVLAVASPEVMRCRDVMAQAVAAAAEARATAEVAAAAAEAERSRVAAAAAARASAADTANRAAEAAARAAAEAAAAAQRAAAAEAEAAAVEAAAQQRADAADAAQRAAEAALAMAADRVAAADVALRAAAVEASAAQAEAARARRERDVAAATAAAGEEAVRLRAAAQAAAVAEQSAAAAETKARATAAEAAARAQAAQAAADAVSGDEHDAELAAMEAHMASEESRLSAMRAQMAEKQREAASRRAQRAADEASAAEAALDVAHRAAAEAAAVASPSPPASPAKAPPKAAAAAVAPPVAAPAPMPVRAMPTATAAVAAAVPTPVALSAHASPEPDSPPAQAAPARAAPPPAPPAPVPAPARVLSAEEASVAAASAEEAYLEEASSRAEAIAEAEAAYHNALSVAELLEIQAAETEELRREDTEAARYMGGEEVRAAQQAAESARRRAAAAAIRTAQARLAALRRTDSDAAAAYAAVCGAPPSRPSGAHALEAGGAAYGDGASPRWPGVSPRRAGVGAARPVNAAPRASGSAVPYYVPMDVSYGEDDAAAAPDRETAAALAAVSRRAHTMRAGVDPYTPAGQAGDAIRAAMDAEQAALDESQIPGMAPSAYPDEGLVDGEDDNGVATERTVTPAAEEGDAWMAEEEAHRAQVRSVAARAAQARAYADEAEGYLLAGPGSRPVDADKAWRLAARLAGGGVEEKALPPALAACTAALLGHASAARAGAWGLHEAVQQATPRELFYLHGSQLLAPLNATVGALTRDRAASDWFATHFAAAALRQLTDGDLSAKYWIEGELGENDNLADADVFFDPGPHGKFELPDDDDLDEVTRRQMAPPAAGRECLLLVKGERELEALIRAAAAVQPRLGSRGSTPAGIRARLSALAQWVCTRCGGPTNDDRVAKAEKQSALLAAHGGLLGLVPLARVTQGLARHRAILFKMLADKLFAEDCVRCRLVRAPRAIAPQGAHVWNVVVLSEPDEAGEVRDVHLLVDLMAERLHGSLEPRLVDERGSYAMEYKATAGFTAYRLEKPPPRPPKHAADLQRVRALPSGTFGASFVARSRAGGGAHSGNAASADEGLYCAKEFAPLTSGSPAEAAVIELPSFKACRHPNVVAVRALLPRNDNWYLLTDLHVAGSWDGALKAQPREATARGELLLRFALEAASGMAYLHARRIAHCDLKPSNLLVTPGGGVAVTDYGLSHLLPPDAQAARVAHWSGAYMAPEARLVMSGGIGGELTPAADVWSFGVCIGQALLHGEYPAPLPAPGTAAAMSPASAALQPYNDAAIAAAEAPRALAAIYRACLSRQPAQRPRFDALVEELERASKAFCAGQRDG